MKTRLNQFISRFLILGFSFFCFSQNVKAQTVYTATQGLELVLQSNEGTNGSAVAWNSDAQAYFTVIAGNSEFPLEKFSSTGEYIYGTQIGVDTRGLWYNPKSKKLEGNGAGDIGLFSISLMSASPSEGVTYRHIGQNQPEFNSVGAFDQKKGIIYYFNDGKVYTYKSSNGKQGKSIDLQGITSFLYDINPTSMIYTGRKNEELGILNVNSHEILLFNLKGQHTGTINLPSTFFVDGNFCFSYCNNLIWLYNVETRIWTGFSF